MMIGNRLLLVVMATAVLAAGPPRLDKWEVVGPGGGGTMYYPTISPHNPSCVLVYCDMTGSYISEDAGESWRMFNLRTTTRFFVFDPVVPATIYAYGLGLWRSINHGKTWSLVYSDPNSVTGIKIAGDHGEESILPSFSAMSAMEVDPGNSQVLYAAVGNRFRISTDWGTTWNEQYTLTDGASRIYIDPVSPAEDRTIYVIGSRTVAVREAAKWRVGQTPTGVTAFTDSGMGFRRDSPPTIYATSGGTLWVSQDGGASWGKAADLPGTKASYAGVATSLFNPDTVYLSYSNLTEPDGRYWFGVARSDDRGQTWNLVYKSANPAPANVTDAWMPGALGSGWAGNPIPRGLAVAPTDANVVFGTDSGRTMRTLDGGKAWQTAYAVQTEDGGYATRGLDVTTCYGLHWDPFDTNRMFISYTDIVLFRSETGGKSWLYSGTGIPNASPNRWRNTVYWMEFDPEVQGRVWAVASYNHDLPRYKMWRSTSPLTFQGGVVVSNDGGKTWRRLKGYNFKWGHRVILDPQNPGMIYVTTFGGSVWHGPAYGDPDALEDIAAPSSLMFTRPGRPIGRRRL